MDNESELKFLQDLMRDLEGMDAQAKEIAGKIQGCSTLERIGNYLFEIRRQLRAAGCELEDIIVQPGRPRRDGTGRPFTIEWQPPGARL